MLNKKWMGGTTLHRINGYRIVTSNEGNPESYCLLEEGDDRVLCWFNKDHMEYWINHIQNTEPLER